MLMPRAVSYIQKVPTMVVKARHGYYFIQDAAQLRNAVGKRKQCYIKEDIAREYLLNHMHDRGPAIKFTNSSVPGVIIAEEVK